MHNMERIGMLNSFLEGFQKKYRRSINNGIYIGQKIMGLPNYYQDFEGFARLGVSSLTLHIDYSFLLENSNKLLTTIWTTRYSKKPET